jgi:hypothetical protein
VKQSGNIAGSQLCTQVLNYLRFVPLAAVGTLDRLPCVISIHALYMLPPTLAYTALHRTGAKEPKLCLAALPLANLAGISLPRTSLRTTVFAKL